MTTMWLTRDERGRPKAAFSRSVPGGEEMDAESAMKLLDERRAEKFYDRPRMERAAIVLSEPAVQLAMLDRDHSDLKIRAAAIAVIASAKARIDMEKR